MFGSSKTSSHHTSHRKNRERGLKASINNPRTTHAGRSEARYELRSMGVKANKPSIGTRIRHALNLPAKSHNKNKRRRV